MVEPPATTKILRQAHGTSYSNSPQATKVAVRGSFSARSARAVVGDGGGRDRAVRAPLPLDDDGVAGLEVGQRAGPQGEDLGVRPKDYLRRLTLGVGDVDGLVAHHLQAPHHRRLPLPARGRGTGAGARRRGRDRARSGRRPGTGAGRWTRRGCRGLGGTPALRPEGEGQGDPYGNDQGPGEGVRPPAPGPDGGAELE